MKTKRILIMFLIALVLLTGCNKKENKEEEPKKEETKISVIEVLKEDNASKAAELIKNNIVKITNTLEKGTITGTGFFNSDGYLITCSHVVDRKGKIVIEYPDGTKDENAELISNDVASDVAILKVETPKVLAMSFGKTIDLKVTDTVFGIGYSYNMEGESSVVKGILSARRSNAGIEYLQTDLSLNEGQSGGPLINSKGELLGMNSLATENSTIGMAISIENLENVIYKLVANPKVAYVEKERGTNALGNILKEVGYKHEDIHDERKYYDDKPKEEEKTPVIKSSNNNLKTFKIPGYTFTPAFNSNRLGEYRVALKGGQTSISPIIETSHSKAKYKIIGDINNIKVGHNEIKVQVTAENGSTKTYFIDVVGTYGSSQNINKISIGLDKMQSSDGNKYRMYFMYQDADGFNINDDYLYDIVKNVKIDVYVLGQQFEEKRLATTINLQSTEIAQTTFYIPFSKIKDTIQEDDYVEGYNGVKNINYKWKITIYTKDGRTIESTYNANYP